MQFKDIIGQDNIKHHLRRSVREGRIPHAQLFSGTSGVGKLQLALAYAQYLACPNRTEEDSCGCCPSCLQYGKLQHPDLHFVFPIVKQENGPKDPVCDDYLPQWREIILRNGYFDLQDWYKELGSETKQGMIYEKESTEILRKLSLKSFGNGYKTMIIWLPEKMNEVCANKLLKILEEPYPETLFLLVSDEPQRLLQTILSRVQQIAVPNLDDATIARALVERTGQSEQTAAQVAHMAQGSYLKALKVAQDDEQNAMFLGLFQTVMRDAWQVGQRKNYDALIDLRKWSEIVAGLGREKQKAFMDYCMAQVRENFITNYGNPAIVYQTAEEQQFSSRFAPFIHEGNVEQILTLFSDAQRQVEQNGNAKIIFFDVALRLIVQIK